MCVYIEKAAAAAAVLFFSYISLSFSIVLQCAGQGRVCSCLFFLFFFECRPSFPIQLDCIFNMSRNYCVSRENLNGPVSLQRLSRKTPSR